MKYKDSFLGEIELTLVDETVNTKMYVNDYGYYYFFYQDLLDWANEPTVERITKAMFERMTNHKNK